MSPPSNLISNSSVTTGIDSSLPGTIDEKDFIREEERVSFFGNTIEIVTEVRLEDYLVAHPGFDPKSIAWVTGDGKVTHSLPVSNSLKELLAKHEISKTPGTKKQNCFTGDSGFAKLLEAGGEEVIYGKSCPVEPLTHPLTPLPSWFQSVMTYFR